jgi:hypothetical protein
MLAPRQGETVMGRQRKLTESEIALARKAFGDRIDYSKVTIVEGAALNIPARLAFLKGNPAITMGSTIYFRDDYCDDFCDRALKQYSFMHEMTHVWQWQKLGAARFLLRYGKEFLQVGGKPGDMYKYEKDTKSFRESMLEAQANMVQHYSEALRTKNAKGQAEVAKRLAGSGAYDL